MTTIAHVLMFLVRCALDRLVRLAGLFTSEAEAPEGANGLYELRRHRDRIRLLGAQAMALLDRARRYDWVWSVHRSLLGGARFFARSGLASRGSQPREVAPLRVTPTMVHALLVAATLLACAATGESVLLAFAPISLLIKEPVRIFAEGMVMVLGDITRSAYAELRRRQNAYRTEVLSFSITKVENHPQLGTVHRLEVCGRAQGVVHRVVAGFDTSQGYPVPAELPDGRVWVEVDGRPLYETAALDSWLLTFNKNRHLKSAGELSREGREWARELLFRAHRGSIYRGYQGSVMSVVAELPQDADYEVLDGGLAVRTRKDGTEVEQPWHLIVLHNVRLPYRPIASMLGVVMVGYDGSITRADRLLLAEIQRHVCDYMARQGTPKYGARVTDAAFDAIAPIKNTWFFGERSRAMRLFTALGVDEKLLVNRFTMVRLGVVLKRTGGLAIDLEMRGRPLPEEYDGTILVTRQVSAPFQGTFIGRTADGKLITAKGIVRPPARRKIEGGWIEEEEGYHVDGQLWQKMASGVKGKFFIVGEFRSEGTNFNQQAAIFTARDLGVGVIRKHTAWVRRLTAHALLAGHQLAMYNAGVPVWALLMGVDVKRFARQMPLEKAVRSKVIALPWIEPGEVWLSHDNYKRLGKPEVGTVFNSLRDPALPTGWSIQKVAFAGTLDWTNGDAENVIAISPYSLEWKELQQGDFDGDSLLLWPYRGEDWVHVDLDPAHFEDLDVKSVEDLKLGRPEASETMELYSEAGSVCLPNFAANALALQTAWSSRVGSVVWMTTVIAEAGRLTDRIRVRATLLIQGCIFAMKHPVRSDVLAQLYDELQDELDKVGSADEIRDSSVVAALNRYKSAVGTESKRKAWDDLLGVALRAVEKPKSELHKALGELVIAVDEKQQELERAVARPEKNAVTLHASYKRAAATLAQNALSREAMDVHVGRARAFRHQYSALLEDYRRLKSEDERREFARHFRSLERRATAALRSGFVNEFVAISLWQASLVAKTVSPLTLSTVGGSRAEIEISLTHMPEKLTLTADELRQYVVDPEHLDAIRPLRGDVEVRFVGRSVHRVRVVVRELMARPAIEVDDATIEALLDQSGAFELQFENADWAF